MRATLLYTASRLLLFITAAALLYLAGARQFLLIGLALLVSGIASYVLLARQRDAMAGAWSARVRSMRDRLNEGTSAEDRD
jgi:uncharacterized membrane protein HdeD (DUF308 family)